jgi:hypothetical protein
MLLPSLAPGRAAMAALVVCGAPFALAQPAPQAPATRPASPVPTFQSAFEGYQRFTDAPPVPWPQANATVHERGGWKAYAQEAQSAPSGEPAAAGAPAGHAGHTLPMPPAKGQP